MLNRIQRFGRNVQYAGRLYRILKLTKDLQPDSAVTIADDFEASVDRDPRATAFIFEGETTDYAAFDRRANQVAHWARAEGYQPGDTVALVLENCPDFLAIWFGLAKVGVVTALINTNLEGPGLAHCIDIVDSKVIIAGAVQAERVKDIADDLQGDLALWDFDGQAGRNFAEALSGQSGDRPDASFRAHLRGSDTVLFIYTSGTTGLPKAATITHMRLRGMARTAKILCDVNAGDRVYNVLPLYHSTGGVLGAAGALTYGAATIVRRKFSASHFWDDIAEHDATLFVYIGELCRYLLNSDPHPKEREHKLRAGFGNGLRGEVWRPFVERFAVPTMRELYGSTEGNVALVNLDGKIGAVGQMPRWIEKKIGVAFVKFDLVEEAPIRGSDGFCIHADDDEAAEVLGRIGDSGREAFAGYHDKKATRAKILTDVFEPGDRWFRTGDLMRRDADGYIYFVDRIGDTFRWKGENVATNEVSDALSKYDGVELANVYGVEVPRTDGRAGMAALTVADGFDIGGLRAHLDAHLPPYAVPLFLRIQPEAETTGTFKYRKVELVKEGFDPAQIDDPLWFRDPQEGDYVPLTADRHKRIAAGDYRY